MIKILNKLEKESINIIRNTYFKSKNPLLLFSGGKDSVVLLYLLHKALRPVKPNIKYAVIDTTYKFKEVYSFLNKIEDKYSINIERYSNNKILNNTITPVNSDIDTYISYAKTLALKEYIDAGKFDMIFTGTRRDEEPSRSKESIYSLRDSNHKWDYYDNRIDSIRNPNLFKKSNESFRVFPLSNWTELNIWNYIKYYNLEVNELYFSRKRPVVVKDDLIYYISDEKLDDVFKGSTEYRCIRFRTLGCKHLTTAIESKAISVDDIILELTHSNTRERDSRLMDKASNFFMEDKKKDGYF